MKKTFLLGTAIAMLAACAFPMAASAQDKPAKPEAVKPAAPKPAAIKPAAAKPAAAPAAKPKAQTKSDPTEQAVLLGQFGDSGAYQATPEGKKVCFALAKPTSAA